MGIEEELSQEWEAAKAAIEEGGWHISDLSIMNAVMINFHTRVPGGDGYRTYDANSKTFITRNLDEKIGDSVNRVFPEDAHHFLAGQSELYVNRTYREVREDVREALIGAGIPPGLLAELEQNQEVNGTDAIIVRERTTMIPILFEAYKTLRRRGYYRQDLI